MIRMSKSFTRDRLRVRPCFFAYSTTGSLKVGYGDYWQKGGALEEAAAHSLRADCIRLTKVIHRFRVATGVSGRAAHILASRGGLSTLGTL